MGWRGTPLALKDERYGAMPLGWAMYGRDNGQVQPDLYEAVIGLLKDAGAAV